MNLLRMTALVSLSACSNAPADPSPRDGGTACAALEQTLAEAIDRAAADSSVTTDPDLTLLLETHDGRRFTHSHGASTATTVYESASTSKWVAAAVLLDLVDQGALTLDSKPHDLIDFWTGEDAITLRHLLSFRSGFNSEPPCINSRVNDYAACTRDIYDLNLPAGIAAGAQFYYASTHLQIAGLMAMKVTGKSWAEIFAAWQARTGLFPNGAFDLPSAKNPRLAGGMHWSGEEYLAFLRALEEGSILSAQMRMELFANERADATVAYSPTVVGLDEDWAYGFGNWLECPTASSYNCGAGHRNSSPGAYGAYPFLDFDHQYHGILARQGALGTYPEGVALFRAVQDRVEEWADLRCPPPSP
jgi:CubicO group peptidase (beta-lactamase class C family)